MKFKEHEIVWDDNKVSRLWNYYSRTYPYNDVYFTKLVGKNIIKKTIKNIGSFENKVLLDFGCGPGHLLKHMVSLNIKISKYIGLDFSEESISNISSINSLMCEKEGIYVKSFPSKIENDSIDVCFLIEVVEHLSDKYLNETLEEIYRVLKPNGYLVVTTPNNEDLNYSMCFCPECGAIYHKYQHVRRWDDVSLCDYLAKYNFKNMKIEKTNLFPCENTIKDFYFKVKKLLKNKKENLFCIFVK